MGAPIQAGARLIKGQVSVGSHAKNLQLNFALGNDGTELGNVGFDVAGALSNIGVGFVDIYMVKEVCIHEITVALLMGGLKADVFVQIHGADLAEIQTLFPAAAGKILIHANGAGAGGKTQTAVGLFADDLFDYICAGGALAFIIIADDYSHNSASKILFFKAQTNS